MTLLTDYALAAVAVALGARLARAAGGVDRRPRQLWAAGFLWGGAAALAGGTVHGFSASLAPVARTALWKTFLVGSAAACALVSAGTALSTLRGTWLRAALLGTAGKLALVLLLASRSDLALVACHLLLTAALWPFYRVGLAASGPTSQPSG